MGWAPGNSIVGTTGTVLLTVSPTAGPIYNIDIYVSFNGYAFINNAGGETDFDLDTAANGISDDGEVVVGFLRDGDGNTQPVMWRDLQLEPLPLVDGAYKGEAESVTTKAGTIKLINPGVPSTNPPFDTPPPEDIPASVETTILKD